MPKISFTGKMCVEHDVLLRNIAYAKSLGLPYVKKPPAKEIKFHGRRLAVVGGGPSVKEHLDELRSWEGEIWGVNGACTWLREAGIESTLFSLDPLPILAKRCVGARKALLCTRCAPELFDALKGAEVTLFDVAQDEEGGFLASCATVLCVPDLATDLGFRDVVYFGCEGSFRDATHLYMNDPQEKRFVVECGGREYLTLPELYVCTVELSALLRAFPAHFTERSGGLLGAMVRNQEHDIVKVSRSLLADLKEAA